MKFMGQLLFLNKNVIVRCYPGTYWGILNMYQCKVRR